MNIFDFAMTMEKDGESYYRELAKKCNDKEGLRKILNMLADDEVKHYQTLEKMKNMETADIEETQILKNVKNIFVQLKEERAEIKTDISQLDLYKKAQEIEKKSEDFYLQKVEELENEKHKQILLKIADEEKKHYYLLQNIIEFVSRPQKWIENAEFHHLEEY
jgi:rubrerythrin